MFVTYLSKTYRDNIECKTPDTLRTPYTKIATGGEAGEVFESVFWGGAIVRSPDGSGRNPINMVRKLLYQFLLQAQLTNVRY